MSFSLGKFRVGDGTGTPIVPAGSDPDTSQGRFRASDVAAPTGASVPIVPPSPGTAVGMPISAREALLLWHFVSPGVAPPGKIFAPPQTDWAWRWRKHQADLIPAPGPTPYITYSQDGVSVEQAPIASGGGAYTGIPQPWLQPDGSAALVDPLASPIWSLCIGWTSRPVTVNGDPGGSFDPIDGLIHSHSTVAPPTPDYTSQPIVGNANTDSPWLLYCRWTGAWLGTPGNWLLYAAPTIHFQWGGGGGATAHLEWPPGGLSLVTVFLELTGHSTAPTTLTFDNTDGSITTDADPSLSTVTGGPPNPFTLSTTPEGFAKVSSSDAGAPGGWPSQQVFGSANTEPAFSPSFRQLEGLITDIAIVSKGLPETVALLNSRSLVPGTGPPSPRIAFRAADAPHRALPARLSEYALYWPLDDAGPGPMYDLVIGAYLAVQNPTYATFGVDGIVDPLSPTHTKALRLDRASDSASATRAFLEWEGSGPVPSLGFGAVGDDLTVNCWIRWEGPPPDTNGNGLEVFRGSLVPSGPANVPSLQATIMRDAEPYGIEFETFQSSTLTYKKIDTVAFDWPADYTLDFGDPLLPYVIPIPYKTSTWALLTLVMRTVGGHMTLEIWVDGVLVTSGPGSDTGWGAAVSFFQFAHNLAPCTIQHLTVWPFALTADEISGLAA